MESFYTVCNKVNYCNINDVTDILCVPTHLDKTVRLFV